MRRRSEILGTALAFLGLVGAAGTVFFLSGVNVLLGEGGTERAAAYVLPLGLALAGAALWRLGADPAAEEERARAKAEREQARAEQAERDRERDEALEASARRHEKPAAEAPEGEDDAEDHWSTPVRRSE